MAVRYGMQTRRLFERERPGGRKLLVSREFHAGQPIVLSEFGGIAFSPDPDNTWGYHRSGSEREFADHYRRLMQAVRSAPMLAGFCYTQFADTYQEGNGLLYADRRPKLPLEEIALATRGPRSQKDAQWEWYWREQLMSTQREKYVIPPQDRAPRSEPVP